MAVKVVITLKCDAILNNAKCSNDAEYETPDDEGGILICQWCLDSLRDRPEKVAFPAQIGKKFQIDLLKKALDGYALKNYHNKLMLVNGELK